MRTKGADRRRSCTGKLDYEIQAAATYAAKTHQWQFKTPFSAYPCEFCGGWHIGHTPGAGGKEVRDSVGHAETPRRC